MMVTSYNALAIAGIVMSAGLATAAQERFEFQRADSVDIVEQRGSFGVVAMDSVDLGGMVLDAPFSADAVTEVTQVLADGNRIEQRRSSAIARNAAGQTRREQNGIAFGTFMAQGAQNLVTITDPKSGVHLTLNYDQKVAYRMKPAMTRLMRTVPDGPAVTYGTAGVMAAGAGEVVLSAQGFEAGRRVGPPPGGEPPAMVFEWNTAGPTTMTAGVAAMPAMPDDNVRIEKLEPRAIEGVPAEGTRTVRTVAAGAMGNLQPIEIVNERWMSPELQVVLMTRRYDPRFGETVYRLTNIVRAEPPADLFKVPADFRTEDLRP